MLSELDFKKYRILVVDDQRPFLIMMKGILNSLGARDVVLKQTGEAALSQANRIPFDILFVDYDLGASRKNGRQLLEELRDKKLLKPESLFVLVTGESHRPLVLSAVEQQPDDYLIKPFSQASLMVRLKKLFRKKKELIGVYENLFREQWDKAIEECTKLIKGGSRHKYFCTTLLVELYWKKNNYVEAEKLLMPLVEENKIPWAALAYTKNLYYQERYDEAIEQGKKVVKSHNLFVEARDIIALSYFKKSSIEDAFQHIKLALDMSPFSLERQFIACKIGQAKQDYMFIKDRCFQIMEQSKRSIHQDVTHFCNYVRSILDAAENADEDKKSNKLQQEAMVALHRISKEDLANEDLNFSAFESLVHARLDSINGRMLKAKKSAFETQQKLKNNEAHQKFLGTDSLIVMSNIGEIEQAKKVANQLGNDPEDLDYYTSVKLQQLENALEAKASDFITENKDGIEAYTNEKYHEAISHFSRALEVAPMNTGAALNLIQAALKQAESHRGLDEDLRRKINKSFKIVEGIELPEAQHQRYTNLLNEFEVMETVKKKK